MLEQCSTVNSQLDRKSFRTANISNTKEETADLTAVTYTDMVAPRVW